MAIKILYLEDDQTIAEVTSEYMKIKNYSVTHVTDGDEALKRVSEEDFDLVILDIMVPGKSGLEILSEIHQKNIIVPVIMLSALEDELTQINAFNLFADDYITKPFSPILLLKRMEAVLRRGTIATKSQKNGLEVKDESYEIWYDGGSLHYTVTEYLIFEKLYRHPKQVFTREQLLMLVFGDDYYPNDRVIDAHIKNIRKKSPINWIKTVIGLGYQFSDEKK